MRLFLLDHLNKSKVQGYLLQFDEYCKSIPDHEVQSRRNEEELLKIKGICRHINEELTLKQKVVIVLELIGIILADGHISDREEEFVRAIRLSFNISTEDIDLMEAFVTAARPQDLNSNHVLIIEGKI